MFLKMSLMDRKTYLGKPFGIAQTSAGLTDYLQVKRSGTSIGNVSLKCAIGLTSFTRYDKHFSNLRWLFQIPVAVL